MRVGDFLFSSLLCFNTRSRTWRKEFLMQCVLPGRKERQKKGQREGGGREGTEEKDHCSTLEAQAILSTLVIARPAFNFSFFQNRVTLNTKTVNVIHYSFLFTEHLQSVNLALNKHSNFSQGAELSWVLYTSCTFF